jgi:hypothetical protein
MTEVSMSLAKLVQRTRRLKAEHPKAASLDWHDCAYLALREEFGVEPSREEIVELAKAAKPSAEGTKELDAAQEKDEDRAKERQTGGGRRIHYKSEFLGG